MSNANTNVYEVVKMINRLIGEGHVIIGADACLLAVSCPIYTLVSDGVRIWALGLKASQTLAIDITDGWIYDLTMEKTLYGSSPASKRANKSIPDQEVV